MDDLSIFTDKSIKPTDTDLIENLGTSYPIWKQLEKFVLEQYPNGCKEWNYPGKKYGYSYRIKDKRRAILYFLPRKKYFKVAFVFGQKATDHIMDSDISLKIKEELSQARKYAEGRGIGITIKDETHLPDIKKLVIIKLSY